MLTPENIPTYAALRNAGVLFKSLSIVATIFLLILACKQLADSQMELAKTYVIAAMIVTPIGLLIGQLIEAYRDYVINSWYQRMLLEKMHYELTRPPSEESKLFRP